LLTDFKDYYSSTLLGSGTAFNKLKLFIEKNKLKYQIRLPDNTMSDNTLIPYGGLYRIELDINFINNNLFTLYNGNEPNANITVRLSPISKAANYNPLYETPFDGDVGGTDRADYGVGITGLEIPLNDTTDAKEYSGALTHVSHELITSLDDLDDGVVLIFDNNSNRLISLPSQPNPVSMKITSSAGSVSAKYRLEGTGSTYPINKEWIMTNSTIGSDKCEDFNRRPNVFFTDSIFRGEHKLRWDTAANGTIVLRSIFFTPKLVPDTLKITSANGNTWFKSYDYLQNSDTIMLNNFDSQGIDNYDSLQGLFDRLQSEEMCISKESEETLRIWWNKEYLDELLTQVDSFGISSC